MMRAAPRGTLAGSVPFSLGRQVPIIAGHDTLGSWIRTRLHIEPYSQEELRDALTKLLSDAGNPNLFTDEALAALAEHAQGNFRSLGGFADEFLVRAFIENRIEIDQNFFLSAFSPQPKEERPASKKRARTNAR